jgi:hypothetical protein
MSTSPSVGQVKGSNGSSQNAGQMPSTRANEKGMDQPDRQEVLVRLCHLGDKRLTCAWCRDPGCQIALVSAQLLLAGEPGTGDSLRLYNGPNAKCVRARA